MFPGDWHHMVLAKISVLLLTDLLNLFNMSLAWDILFLFAFPGWKPVLGSDCWNISQWHRWPKTWHCVGKNSNVDSISLKTGFAFPPCGIRKQFKFLLLITRQVCPWFIYLMCSGAPFVIRYLRGRKKIKEWNILRKFYNFSIEKLLGNTIQGKDKPLNYCLKIWIKFLRVRLLVSGCILFLWDNFSCIGSWL